MLVSLDCITEILDEQIEKIGKRNDPKELILEDQKAVQSWKKTILQLRAAIEMATEYKG